MTSATKNIWVKIEGNFRKVYTYKDADGFTLKVWPKAENQKMVDAGFSRPPFVIGVFLEGDKVEFTWRGREEANSPEHRTCVRILDKWLDANPKIMSKMAA